MRLKDIKTVKAMIDRINAKGGGGEGGGDNLNTYALVSGDGFWETTRTEITNENDIAELEKMYNLFLGNGTIPTIVAGEGIEDGNTNVTVIKGYYMMSNSEGDLSIDAFEEGDPVTLHNIERDKKSDGSIKWYAQQMGS